MAQAGVQLQRAVPHTGLPEGVSIRSVYDRSQLIDRAIATLRTTLAARARAELGFDLGFSTGLAQLQADDADLQPLVQRADAALYAAKAAGRGQLATAPG